MFNSQNIFDIKMINPLVVGLFVFIISLLIILNLNQFLDTVSLFHCLRVAGRTRRPPMLYFTV